MKESTIGRLLLEDALPPQLRPHVGVLNQKGIRALAQILAEHHTPEEYRDTMKRLTDLSAQAGFESGGYSFGTEHMRADPETQGIRDQLNAKVQQILNNPGLKPHIRDAELVRVATEHADKIQESVMRNGSAQRNPLALQVESGAKGKAENLKALIAGDTLYTDSQYNPIAYPILHSFAEGLRPHEYMAGAFGARLAIALTKLGTASGGFLSKRLNNLAHRLVVTASDADKPHTATRGIESAVGDPDNEGALLAHPAGGYPRNTVLSREVINHLKQQGVKDMLIRSPLVGGPGDGGLYGRDVGVRERQKISPVGDYVGLAASQALSEPVTQLIIGSKHSGGVAGATKGQQGFPAIDRLFSVPSEYAGAAVHAKTDGLVTSIEEAPQGGKYVTVGDETHYVPVDREVRVQPGGSVEHGDPLTDGVENPAEVVPAKGIGEGRKRFVQAFMNIARASGFNPNRRNVEVVARGYLDHVRLDREEGEHSPGDVVSYTWLENHYTPREGAQARHPKESVGRYLEEPVLHYTLGTKVQPSMLPVLSKWGVKSVLTHEDQPHFTPLVIRSHDIPSYDRDWLAQGLGSGLEKNLLKSVHRGAYADTLSTSYVPALAHGIGFGEKGKTVGWTPEAAKPPGG